MPREFDVPSFYKSPAVLAVKNARRSADPKKRDLNPTVLDFGPVRFHLARHFGFCFGVENAIEIAYRVLRENPEKRIYLLSEMIHNPQVNADLESKGVQFLMKTDGTRLVDFSILQPDDIVIVPAFGTTVELQKELTERNIDPYRYNATCPFVEKVWKRAHDLGKKGFSVILHGKRMHEETRATFSHSKQTTPTLVLLNIEEAKDVVAYMRGTMSLATFEQRFAGCMSEDFDPEQHLQRIGVVNQTTMLATETQAIAELFRNTIIEMYGEEKLTEHYADTRDTLCYATYENQSATLRLKEAACHLALVVGGYNSSNTSHLVELLEERMPTYYIKDAAEIISDIEINHFDMHAHQKTQTFDWIPQHVDPLDIAITAGASCPDSAVDAVIERILAFFPQARARDEALQDLHRQDQTTA